MAEERGGCISTALLERLLSHGELPRLPPYHRLALGARVGVDLGLSVAEGEQAGSEPEAVGGYK